MKRPPHMECGDSSPLLTDRFIGPPRSTRRHPAGPAPTHSSICPHRGGINPAGKSGDESPHSKRAAAAAFTLVEILIAMAIASMVVVGMSTLIFSMGELWGRNTDLRLYEQHTRNVTRFLEHELSTAALPPTGGTAGAQSTAGAGASAGSGAAKAPVTVQEIRDQTGNSDWYITYELPRGSRICAWPDRALPYVVCSLAFRPGQGLVLLWHSRLETNFDIDAPRETVITPLVTAVSYDYYDSDLLTWKNETVLRKDNSNQGLLPQRLRLVFTYSGRTIETILDIPGPPSQGLPML